MITSVSVSDPLAQTSKHSLVAALDAMRGRARCEGPVLYSYGAEANELVALEIGDCVSKLRVIAVGIAAFKGDVARDAIWQTLLVHDFAQVHAIN